MIKLQIAAGAALVVLWSCVTAQARTYVVNDHGDHRPRACTHSDCTLREAVIAANEHAGADAISLPDRAPHVLSIASTGEDSALDGDLDITSGPLKIVHHGPGRATIDADGTDRVFDIGAAKTRLASLTIRGGQANAFDAGGDGGGIAAGDLGDAPVTIVDSRIVGNRAPAVDGNGGGIDTDIAAPGKLRVVDSFVGRNEAGGDGGGITASTDGPTVITRTTFYGNEAGEGAGLMAVGQVNVTESLFAFNRAVGGGDGEVGDGAGIYVDDGGVLSITNSTLTENQALAAGGGLFAETGAIGSINSVTIARNRATGSSGGVHLEAATSIALTNSILALNQGASGAIHECGGAPFTNAEPNLITTDAGGCNAGAAIVAADPLIGSLSSNGGPTQTLPLLPGSPAINAANDALSPPSDQRGVARDDPDLGAFELR